MNHRIAWLDVFAERPLAGNGLAVVDDADDVGDETMLAFARETATSRRRPSCSRRRPMAPTTATGSSRSQELPFAGHPSLGTAVAVARWRGLDEASFVQETGAGLQPIEVSSEGQRWRAEMVQNEAEFGTALDPEAVMHAVGLNSAEAHQDLPPQIVSTGLPTAIVPVSEPARWPALAPDFESIDACSREHSPVPARRRPSTWSGSTRRPSEARARMFSRAVMRGRGPRNRLGGRSARAPTWPRRAASAS